MLAQINGINLYYNDLGRADLPPIVLIHGFPFSSEMWQAQVEALQKRHLRIITYDIRGHGRSDVGDGQYTIELFVDDLMALLDHLKVTKTMLCGFSMGGYIALRAIERSPERFSSLVLCDTTSRADPNEAKIKRANSIKIVKNEGVEKYADIFLKAVFAPTSFATRTDMIEKTRGIILANPKIGICGALLAMAARTDTTEALSKIRVPTLILVGEHDTVTPPGAARDMHDRIPDCRLRIIENTGHMSSLEDPDAFNGHLMRFVDEINLQ